MKLLKNTMIGLAVTLLCVTAGATRSEAAAFVLSHNNSVVNINTSTQAGVSDWIVDGQDQLFQQWFWYRIGASGPEASLDTLPVISETTGFGTRGVDVDRGTLSGLEIEVTYFLTGSTPGSGTSSLAEEIHLINHTAATMDLHFFQYSDFDMAGTMGGDSVQFVGVGSNTVQQSDVSGGSATETVVTPGPTHHEAALFPSTLNKLNDLLPTTLNDVSTAGPGDVTWAYQWDFTLGAGASALISKNKLISPTPTITATPEPASLVLFGFGLIGAAGAARRKKAMAPQA